MKRLLPKKVKLTLILIIVIWVGLWVIRLYNSTRFHLEKETRLMMDTYVTIYALGPKKATVEAINLAFNRMQEIDTKFNLRNPKSPLYAFNHQGIAISDPEILDVVHIALEVSKKSNGAFDITILPLGELWGFTTRSPHLPSEQEIKETLKKIGYQHLVFEDGKLIKDQSDVAIDLGGIAKGYAILEALKVLKAKKITSALIDAGGDVYALGKKGTKLWKVGIRNPRGKDQEDFLGYLEVEDLVVMGSGDYERFFIKDGRRYHHIFDPKTGYPTEGVNGVTLIYPDPVLAQAWTKIPFIVGPKKGLEMLEKIPGMEAIIVTASKEILYSSGLKHTLKTIPKSE